MKKLCLLLALCTAVCCLGSTAAADESGSKTKSAVLTACDSVVQTVFKSDKEVYGFKSGNICLNVVEADDPMTDYLQPAFFKYDISDYSELDIKEAVIVWKSGNYKAFTLFDVPNDDLSLSYGEGASVPNRITVGSLITSRTYNYKEISPDLSGTYDGIPEGYNLAFDVTSYVKNKIHTGKQSFSVMVYSKWGGPAVLDGRGAQLWIKYDTNTKPSIKLNSPEGTDAVSGESIRVSAEVTDADGTVAKVTVTFDGKEYETVQSGDLYKATIPATRVGDGAHEILIYAADERGAERTLEKTIYCKSYTVGNAMVLGKDGGEIDMSLLKAGEKVTALAEITSMVKKELPVTVMLCLYDRYNVMKAFNTETVTMTEAGSTQALETSVDIPNDTEVDALRFCVYITNGFQCVKAVDTGSKGAGL